MRRFVLSVVQTYLNIDMSRRTNYTCTPLFAVVFGIYVVNSVKFKGSYDSM